ncbi:MAG: leucine-rich repeat domain-containing protein [Pirellulaceae bacterium]
MGGFAWRLQRARRQAKAVATIRALGGGVGYYDEYTDADGAESRPKKTSAPAGSPFLQKWLGEDFFREVYFATISADKRPSPEERNEFWQAAGQFGKLRSFSMDGEGWFERAAFAKLQGSPTMREICLMTGETSNEDLAIIGTMPGIVSLSLTGPTIDDQGIANLDRISQLRHFQLQQAKITDAGVAHFVNHPELQSLNLSWNPITDRCTLSLAKLEKLKWLDLGSTGVTDQGLANLSTLPELRTLNLAATKITDAGLMHLRQMRTLENLNVVMTGVHGPGFIHLRELPKLRYVNLLGCPITDDDVKYLQHLSHVENLDLRSSKMTDAGFANLTLPPKVKTISLPSRTRITDKTLEALSRFPQLKIVQAHRTDVTPEGIAAFQKALPGCRVAK